MSSTDAGMCDGQVSEYLGDLRMRSVNMAMRRVGSRQNMSSTAAAFMDLAEEEEEDNVSRGCALLPVLSRFIADPGAWV